MENTAFSVRLLQGVREGKVLVPLHRSGEPFHPLSMVLLERGRGGGLDVTCLCSAWVSPLPSLSLQCPSAPRTTLCVSTSISQASDSLLYLRDVSSYPLPPSVSPKTCASLLFCHDGTVGLRGPWLLKTEARPILSTSAFPGTVHATQQNIVNIC